MRRLVHPLWDADRKDEVAVGSEPLVYGLVKSIEFDELTGRLQVWLDAQDGEHPILVELHRPPRTLRDALTQGGLVGCLAAPRGAYLRAYWVEVVMAIGEDGSWEECWRAPRKFVRNGRDQTGMSHPISRPTGSTRPMDMSAEKVWGNLVRLERRPQLLSLGTVLPEDEGPLIELWLRRAPVGLLTALTPGARVLCLAAPHMDDPQIRFSSRVLAVELKVGDADYREVWRHDPTRERETGPVENHTYDESTVPVEAPPDFETADTVVVGAPPSSDEE